MQYRRSRAQGATFFFTVVTYNRKRILCHKANVALIKEAFQHVIKQHPFRILAFARVSTKNLMKMWDMNNLSCWVSLSGWVK